MSSAARHLRLVARDAATEATWVQRALDGDRAAQQWLFEANARYVTSVLANLRVPNADLPDLVQEVFASAFRSLDRLHDASRLRAWLVGIAVRKAMAAGRARRRKWWLSFFEPADVPTLVAEDAPADVREAVRATHTILATLDEELRVVFVLRYLEGLTVDEIAIACEVSPATVKRRISAARASFMERARLDPRLERWTAEEALT